MVDLALSSEFIKLFGAAPTALATSPGRVNIIGEHTDYNDGFVMPCALQFDTKILCSVRDDDLVNAYSVQYPGENEQFYISHELVPGQLAWGNYLRGVVNELKKAGYALKGCNILITSDVPQGSGLSSSAALEVAFAGLLNHLSALGLSEQDIARVGQAAENNFIDCQCGIMDQLISAKAKYNHAMMIDCRDLTTRAVPLPSNLTLMVINSNYPRKLADSEYNQRRLACELAAKTMQVPKLRDATMQMLDAVKDKLDDVTFRRAKHIISENARVVAAADALEKNDLQNLYKIMAEAHISLKCDFEITVAATDGLVDICNNALRDQHSDSGNNSQPEQTHVRGVARQTGGGFGGAIVCLCEHDDVDKVISAVDTHYHANFSLNADIYVCEASEGLHVINL
ncbi:galactokinase [Glaciecola petra]|uniref:Galactokinase n=1 Tax=Glaciecola petra TaxID=3075602 RepID=A0ABU2ZUZ8_9ALTE|nr:galactokinase [Aestuariibacter sp. P117]MDT0596081.1 galactokinase [Aestuariibacter sp. P117]